MKIAATTPYRDVYETESRKSRCSNRLRRHAAVRRVPRWWTASSPRCPGARSGCRGILCHRPRRLRAWCLFPWSDIDLLFLSAPIPWIGPQGGPLRPDQSLWDMRLKLGQTSRTRRSVGGCIATTWSSTSVCWTRDIGRRRTLIHASHAAGDSGVSAFQRARIGGQPGSHDSKRQARHGNTIFHLEPNLKESPAVSAINNVAHCWRVSAASLLLRRRKARLQP